MDYGILDEEKKTETTEAEKNYIITDDGEVILIKTGKRIKLRRKTGAHHMVENRLMAACIPRGSDKDDIGVNIGDMVALGDIRAIISVEAIDGKSVRVPTDLKGVFELMAEFVYDNDVDEWSDFKMAVTPNKEKVEEAAKNLRSNAGLETGLALPTGAGQE